jgi:peptidoglycan/xylan/chitin deacetylase (PgdA/CDA1 family)
MIPVDDAPGGLDAEVDRYLLTLLQRETGLIPTYIAALTALHHVGLHIRHHQSFAALTPDQMDAILHDVAAGATESRLAHRCTGVCRHQARTMW